MRSPLATVASRFVTIDGGRLEYQWHGPSANEAPTIVFLHELDACRHSPHIDRRELVESAVIRFLEQIEAP